MIISNVREESCGMSGMGTAWGYWVGMAGSSSFLGPMASMLLVPEGGAGGRAVLLAVLRLPQAILLQSANIGVYTRCPKKVHIGKRLQLLFVGIPCIVLE